MYTIQHTLYLPYNDCIICNICMRHCIPCFIFIPYYYSLISPTSLQVIFIFGFFSLLVFYFRRIFKSNQKSGAIEREVEEGQNLKKNRIITLKKNKYYYPDGMFCYQVPSLLQLSATFAASMLLLCRSEQTTTLNSHYIIQQQIQ